jgi:D-alanine-D-alanine ligase
VAGAGVPAPGGIVIDRNMNWSLNGLKFPLIVKPVHGDGSEGINAKSYVKNPAVLERRVHQLMRRSPQPILCEEYVPGREIILTLSGVKKISIDSICELVFPRKSQIKFATELAKFDQRYRTQAGIFYRTPTRLTEPLRTKVADLAQKAYRALEIRAYAKIEFRVSGDRVMFIEANPNSQLSRSAHSTDFASIGYENFIRKIVRMALERRRH